MSAEHPRHCVVHPNSAEYQALRLLLDACVFDAFNIERERAKLPIDGEAAANALACRTEAMDLLGYPKVRSVP